MSGRGQKRTLWQRSRTVTPSLYPWADGRASRIAQAISSGGDRFFLFATVIGSGIMAANLSGGNDAVALLGNTIATGAMLFVLITMLGPISGAHMNPAVSIVAALRRELRWTDAGGYIAAQLLFGILGAWAAHLMFDLPTLQLSVKARTGLGQWTGEAIATFGLILNDSRYNEASSPMGARFGRALHNGRLLVHLIDQLREPGHYRGTKSLTRLPVLRPPTFRCSLWHS